MLDVENQRWEKNVIGEMTMRRSWSAVVSVENVGTYIIGGEAYQASSDMKDTTDFLESGLTKWTAGPDLPVSMIAPCAVNISPLSFLAIDGYNIREYQVDVTNPTSSSRWQEANKWPRPQRKRSLQPGCALTNDYKVVIAGGYHYGYLKSSEVLDLATKTITPGGDMTSPRVYLHLATITLYGAPKIFAIGGDPGSTPWLDSVEEFHPKNKSWTLAPTLGEIRGAFALASIQKHLVCRT